MALGPEVKFEEFEGGTILYDSSRASNASSGWLDAAWWAERGTVSATPEGRGGAFLIEADGRSLVLRAELDVIVTIANCPHVLDTRHEYSVTPVRVSAWRGVPATEQDEFRGASPEALRAFLNTEEYFRR